MRYPVKEVGLRHIDWVGLILTTDLPNTAKSFAMYLSRFMNRDQNMAWPSYSRITSELSLSRQTVSRVADLLESEGWLIREKGNAKKTTRYIIGFPQEVESGVKRLSGSSSTQELPRECPSSTQELRSSTEELGVVPQSDSNSQVNKPMNRPASASTDAFDAFWQAYPKRVEKKKAQELFRRLPAIQQRMAIDDVRSGRYTGTDKRFIPNPTTYLRGERWEDERTDAPQIQNTYAGAI